MKKFVLSMIICFVSLLCFGQQSINPNTIKRETYNEFHQLIGEKIKVKDINSNKKIFFTVDSIFAYSNKETTNYFYQKDKTDNNGFLVEIYLSRKNKFYSIRPIVAIHRLKLKNVKYDLYYDNGTLNFN
jgi:hypothetical protein